MLYVLLLVVFYFIGAFVHLVLQDVQHTVDKKEGRLNIVNASARSLIWPVLFGIFVVDLIKKELK